MTIDLYFAYGSPPCQLVELVGTALGLKFNRKPLNLAAGDHRKPEYLKINPQGTAPTIVDNGFSLWESRTIIRYLINKYGENSNLYPKDPKARAEVDQRLDFDLGTLYTSFGGYYYPQIFGSPPAPANPELFKKLENALKLLNTFLEGQKYAAGPELTLADLALVVTVSTIDAVGISIAAYPNIVKWHALVKSEYEKEINSGIESFRAIVNK